MIVRQVMTDQMSLNDESEGQQNPSVHRTEYSGGKRVVRSRLLCGFIAP